MKQRILTEKIAHIDLVKKINMGAIVEQYAKNEKQVLQSSFYNALIPSLSKELNKVQAEEAGFEFDRRFELYMSLNSDASVFEQQQYAKQLNFDLQDKYNDISIEDITAFNLEENKFNVVREAGKILEEYEALQADPSKDSILKTLARLNGYVDENGKPQVNRFMNEYRKILEKRQEG